MKIKFKIPAIVVDDDGNEQAIDIAVESNYNFIAKHAGRIEGYIIFQHLVGSFSFLEEHPFKV